MQSPQPWIIWQHWVSPLVQVKQTPLSVISHLHRPCVRLKYPIVMPLHWTQQLHMPPANIVHRFCTMLAAILSSQTQVNLTPPVHFSTLNVQRGTIIQFVPVVPTVGVPTVGVP